MLLIWARAVVVLVALYQYEQQQHLIALFTVAPCPPMNRKCKLNQAAQQRRPWSLDVSGSMSVGNPEGSKLLAGG